MCIRDRNSPVRSIGLDKSRIPFPLPGFVPVRNAAELCPGITLITDIPRLEGNFQAVKYFFLDREGLSPDLVLDDACLAVDTAQGLVVVLGCCHSGLANTLERAAQVMGVKEFHAVLGGLHLIGAGTGPIQESARALEKFQVQRILAGHCTGESEAGQFANLLPGRVFPLGAGLVVDF